MQRVGEGVRIAVADGRSIDHYDDDAEPVNRARALRVFIFTSRSRPSSHPDIIIMCIIYNIYFYTWSTITSNRGS